MGVWYVRGVLESNVENGVGVGELWQGKFGQERKRGEREEGEGGRGGEGAAQGEGAQRSVGDPKNICKYVMVLCIYV